MIEVVEARRHHCGMMIRRARRRHLELIAAAGADAHRELISTFERSSFRRSVFADGRIVAMGGITGSAIAPLGFAWMMLAEDFSKPLTIVRLAAQEIERAMETRSEIATTVLVGDDAALRFAIFLGFHVSHGDEGDEAGDRSGRMRLLQHIIESGDIRLPVGKVTVIPMGLH